MAANLKDKPGSRHPHPREGKAVGSTPGVCLSFQGKPPSTPQGGEDSGIQPRESASHFKSVSTHAHKHTH